MKAVRWSGFVVLVIAFAAACDKTRQAPPDPELPSELQPHRTRVDVSKIHVPALMASVPADTPYLVAVLDGSPAFSAMLDRMRGAFGAAFTEATDALTRDDSRAGRVYRVIAKELDGKWSAAGLESLGFAAPVQLALYGLGLQPAVLRMTIKDQDKLLAAIQRVAAGAGEQLQPPEIADGRTYWKVSDSDVTLVVGFADHQLIAAIGSSDAVAAKLGAILGDDRPAQNMADGKLVKDLMVRHGLGADVLGFADTRLLARAVFAAAGTTSPACVAQIDALASRVPRLVTGVGETTPHAMSGAMIVELAPDLAAEVGDARAAVPGLISTLSSSPMFAIGVGVDLARGQKLALAAADGLGMLGAACKLDSLEVGAGEAARELAQPLSPPLGQIAGGALAIRDARYLGNPDHSPIPDRLDAVGELASPDARALAEHLFTLAPRLRSLGVTTDGKLHDLTSPIPLAFGVSAGVGDRAIVVASGDGRVATATALLDARATRKAPLLAFAYDYGRFLDLVLQMQALGGGPLKASQAATYQAMRGALGRIAAAVDVSDKGVELWSTVQWP